MKFWAGFWNFPFSLANRIIRYFQKVCCDERPQRNILFYLGSTRGSILRKLRPACLLLKCERVVTKLAFPGCYKQATAFNSKIKWNELFIVKEKILSASSALNQRGSWSHEAFSHTNTNLFPGSVKKWVGMTNEIGQYLEVLWHDKRKLSRLSHSESNFNSIDKRVFAL